jgi:hypothetical protein
MDFLGTAAAFPFRPDGKGGLAIVSGVAAVEDSLRAIIESLRGSHRLEPWLGVPSFLFQPMPDLHAAAQIVKDAIINAEDRVEAESLLVMTAIGDSGLMQITVNYTIAGDATERTLELGYRLLN